MSIFDGLVYNMYSADIKSKYEFDIKNFIDVSSSFLENANDIVPSADISSFIKVVEDAKNELSNFTLDRQLMNTFLGKLKYSTHISNYIISPVERSSVEKVIPSVIDSYMMTTKVSIDKAYAGTLTSSEFDNITNSYDNIKKSSVILRNPIGFSYKNYALNKDNKSIVLTDKYLHSNIIPYIASFEEVKKNILSESGKVIEALSNVESDFVKIPNVMKTMGDNVKAKKVAYISLRNTLDLCSYISTATVIKIRDFIKNGINIRKLYEEVVTESSILTESIEEMFGVIPEDTYDIANNLSKGDVSAYSVYANNIYEFHKGRHITVDNVDDPDEASSNGKFMQGNLPYDKSPYEDILRIFIEINQGLDIIAGASDEYLMVFDDIINRTGFVMDLSDKYQRRLDIISDLSKLNGETDIHPDGATDEILYRSLLCEVKDYPENMGKIAEEALNCKTRIKSLIKRFDSNINGEFRNADDINRLKIFLNDLLEQYDKLLNIIASKTVERLRKLGITLFKIDNVDPEEDQPYVQPITIDPTNYLEACILDNLETEESYYLNKIAMLEENYYKESYKKIYGKNLVIEAVEEVPQDNTQQVGNDKKPSTNPKVLDKFKSGIGGLGDKISEFFDQLVQKFIDFATKIGNSKDVERIQENQAAIKSHNFTEGIQMLPYDKYAFDKHITQIDKVKNNLAGMTPQNIQGISNKSVMAKSIFAGLEGLTDINEENLKSLGNYCKCLSFEEPKLVKYTDADANRLVDYMINYVLNYSSNNLGRIKNSINGVKDALNTAISSLNTVQESVMYEEETPTGANKNTQTDMSVKVRWMKEIVQLYVGSELNAIRDANQDFIKVLVQLLPEDQQNNQSTNESYYDSDDDSILFEEKAEWKRHLNSVLKEFNYNPRDKTIKYKGNTYNLFLTRNKPTSTNGKGTIWLNINESRDSSTAVEDYRATILHEIGHIRTNDNKQSNTFTTQQSNIKDEMIQVGSNLSQLTSNKNLITVIKGIRGGVYTIKNLPLLPKEAILLKKYYNKEKMTEEELAQLDKAMHSKQVSEIIKKNRTGKDTDDDHTLQKETQADLYAAKHSSYKQTANMLNNMYKNLDNFDAYFKKMKSEIINSSANELSDNAYEKFLGLEKQLQTYKNQLNNIQNKSDKKEYDKINNKIKYYEFELNKLKSTPELTKARILYNKAVNNDSIKEVVKNAQNTQKRDRDFRLEALKTSSRTKAGEHFTKIGEDDGSKDKNNLQTSKDKNGNNVHVTKGNQAAIIKPKK